MTVIKKEEKSRLAYHLLLANELPMSEAIMYIVKTRKPVFLR